MKNAQGKERQRKEKEVDKSAFIQMTVVSDDSKLYTTASFFFFKDFLMPLFNLLQYCFCFMFQFFGCEACGIIPPRPGIELTPHALEGKVLTSGPLDKSPLLFFR